jgi:hypothetical protein
MKEDSYERLVEFIDSRPGSWQRDIAAAPYFVNVKPHPALPLYKLKYSQFESPFDDPIVRCCRGSVVEVIDGKAKLVQAPFYKFCNRGETVGEDEITFPAWALDKVDGSLAIYSKYDGKDLWTTSGSFAISSECPDDYDNETEPETLGLKTFEDLIYYSIEKAGGGWKDAVTEGWTLMFEILSPRNRIIVKNYRTELVFLGARGPDFVELDPVDAKLKFDIPFRVPQMTRVLSWEDVEKLLAREYTSGIEREGLVILDDRWHRVKIKSDAYRALKFVKGEDNFNERRIFEAIASGDIDDAVSAWPEITNRVETTRAKLEKVKTTIGFAVQIGHDIYAEAFSETGDHKAAKKRLAEQVVQRPKCSHQWLFAGAGRDVADATKQLVEKLTYDKFSSIVSEVGLT